MLFFLLLADWISQVGLCCKQLCLWSYRLGGFKAGGVSSLSLAFQSELAGWIPALTHYFAFG